MIASSLIDIGINLTHDSFNSDRDSVIARAAQAGVLQMIVTGSNGPSTQAAIQLARNRAGVLFATAGVHPHYARELNDELLAELVERMQKRKVSSIVVATPDGVLIGNLERADAEAYLAARQG